ncbi:MAG: hypothetical protein GW859_02325 [Sphingomonadales bacterium]|nr:hypothetical protein [Sphingomonadales bacterium]
MAVTLFAGAMTGWAQTKTCIPEIAQFTDEVYDPSLGNIDTLDKAEFFLRGQLAKGYSDEDAAEAIARFLRARFYHGFSEYRICEDWISRFAGFANRQWLSPIRPEKIMRYKSAGCSQNALVFQELLRRFGISYATVSFWHPWHRATAAKIDGDWYFFDANIEPHRPRLVSMKELLQGDVLRDMYRGKPGVPGYGPSLDLGLQFQQAAKLGKITFTDIDHYPAERGAMAHRIVAWLSVFGWLVGLVISLLAIAVGPQSRIGFLRRAQALLRRN